MQYPDSNYWYAGITSQYTSTIGPQYSESSNTEYDSNGNTPTTPTSYSGFSSSGLYSPQYSGVQNDSYADANFETAFEGALTSRPTFNSLGWTMNSPNVRLYSFRVPKCKEPYFELKSPFTPTTETPRKIYLDEAKNPKKGEYPCQYPWGCRGKQNIFSRLADLERHYKNVHGEIDDKDIFPCDYDKCERSRVNMPFTRKDHLRDHLRDYHKEDMGEAKGLKRENDAKKRLAMETAWKAERVVKPQWWRCIRCLVKIFVASNGWECPQCKNTCEQERQEARMKLENAEVTEANDEVTDPPDTNIGSLNCDACHNTRWVISGTDWVACQCQWGM